MLSVWSLAIASTSAIIVGAWLALIGAVSWHDVATVSFFRSSSGQGGYLVSLLAQAAMRSVRPDTIPSLVGNSKTEPAYQVDLILLRLLKILPDIRFVLKPPVKGRDLSPDEGTRSTTRGRTDRRREDLSDRLPADGIAGRSAKCRNRMMGSSSSRSGCFFYFGLRIKSCQHSCQLSRWCRIPAFFSQCSTKPSLTARRCQRIKCASEIKSRDCAPLHEDGRSRIDARDQSLPCDGRDPSAWPDRPRRDFDRTELSATRCGDHAALLDDGLIVTRQEGAIRDAARGPPRVMLELNRMPPTSSA